MPRTISVVNVILLGIIIGGAAAGVGFLIGSHSVGDPNADPYKYCYHVNTNSSYIHQFVPWAPPGIYAICKVG